jgi:hypothetical protein
MVELIKLGGERAKTNFELKRNKRDSWLELQEVCPFLRLN